jgi:Lrp/AsnC family transcriptional regulator for asnA, asnC and gidA
LKNFRKFAYNYLKPFIMKKYILDEIDHQILDMLIENARTPFTDIAKKLLVSAGTIHVRVKKMEEEGIIRGSTLTIDYEKMGYSFIAHIGIYLDKTNLTQNVVSELGTIPNITVAYITAGKYNIFCKVRAKDTNHAKDIIFQIDAIDGVSRTETMISLEESINDKKRMMHAIFRDL